MVGSPLWVAFSLLFLVAGGLHMVRALRRDGSRRQTGLWLAVSCGFWSAAAALLRFVGMGAAAAAGLIAIALMVAASVAALREAH